MRLRWNSAVLATSVLLSGAAHAGLYADDLSRCLVAETSARDKTDLVRWIFANAALHPEVASIATVSPENRQAVNRAAGTLLQRLLTESCRKQTEVAVKYEGTETFRSSFEMLGRVAMQELMTHPGVQGGFQEFLKFVDQQKLAELLGGAAR